MSDKSDIGIIGLGTRGQNLARCFADKGMRVVVFNPPTEGEDSVLETFIGNYDGDFVGTRDLSVFIELLDRPRVMHLMIKPGKPVDQYLEKIAPMLDEGDIIVDGGSSHYKDTQKRLEKLKNSGINYVGMGISGKKSGVSKGPALMPGGSEEAKSWIMKLYDPITGNNHNQPLSWMGPDGTGHFAKMVHNGILNAEMQLMAEACTYLKGLELSNAQIASVFGEWNQSIAGSYLMQISATIMTKKTGDQYLFDQLEDKIGQSESGTWMMETALKLKIPIPSLSAAVDIRHQSLYTDKRRIINELNRLSKSIKSTNKSRDIEELKQALLSVRILIYSQVIDFIKGANTSFGWNIPIPQLIGNWNGGAVIRANILENIEASVSSVETGEFLANNPIKRVLFESMPGLSKTISNGISGGLALPVMNSSFQHYTVLSSKNLNLALIQAQRDYLGAHGYVRKDAIDGHLDYTDWNE